MSTPESFHNFPVIPAIEPLLDIKTVAKICGVSVFTLHRSLTEKGRTNTSMPPIKAVRLGRQIRFRPADVNEWIKKLPSYAQTLPSPSEREVIAQRMVKVRSTVKLVGRPTKVEQLKRTAEAAAIAAEAQVIPVFRQVI